MDPPDDTRATTCRASRSLGRHSGVGPFSDGYPPHSLAYRPARPLYYSPSLIRVSMCGCSAKDRACLVRSAPACRRCSRLPRAV